MRLTAVASLTTLLLMSASTGRAADPAVESMPSFQGFAGILNTPSAHVVNEGSIHLMYTDQRENIWRTTGQSRQDNYLLSVGFFNFLELGGRVTDTDVPLSRYRDLSASVKVTTAPLTRGRDYWPVLSAGIQDIGGGANLLQSKYLAISEDIWRFRFSAGYGFDSDRMQGGFGGVEFRAHDWVTLLGEYDTKDTNAGIRLVTPEIWRTPIQLTATLKTALNHDPGKMDVSFGLTFPLGFQKRAGRVADPGNPADPVAKPEGKQAIEANQAATSAGVQPPPARPASPEPVSTPAMSTAVKAAPAGSSLTNTVSSSALESFAVLQKHLVAAGFINVQVGQRYTRELIVEYENTIFNHNELDALGVVAGIVSEDAPEAFEIVRIVIKRKGIRVAVVSAPRTTLRAYMKQTGDVRALKDSLSFTYDTRLIDDTYFLPVASGFPFPNTSLILAPGLTTFVATEVGVFDYLLSFKPEIVSNLWKGGVLQLRWDIPVVWSNNFDDGNIYSRVRKNPNMDRAMLYQGLNLAPGLMANLGAGMVLHNNYGTLNEVTWSPGEGTHRLRGVQAWSRDDDTRRVTKVYLGSYRYLFAPLDLSLEATAGRFWGQDEGFSVELKRFFRDTAVSAYYKNTKTLEDKRWQAAGIQFAFPLTPRKDLKIGPVQVRGADEWAYSQESTLAVGGQKTNDVVSQGLAVNPQPTPALYRSYYNRDRLSAAYVEQHLDRLREAWLKYGPELYGQK